MFRQVRFLWQIESWVLHHHTHLHTSHTYYTTTHLSSIFNFYFSINAFNMGHSDQVTIALWWGTKTRKKSPHFGLGALLMVSPRRGVYFTRYIKAEPIVAECKHTPLFRNKGISFGARLLWHNFRFWGWNILDLYI